ncbi:hypothetical protein N9R79_01195 [Vibrio sp.]|nr:hypothetical protein [Vibrio sp.]
MLSLFEAKASGDDSDRNKLARLFKKKIQVYVNSKELQNRNAFCNVYIEMAYQHQRGIVKSIKTQGNRELCQVSKKAIKVGTSHKYPFRDKYLRLHIKMK